MSAQVLTFLLVLAAGIPQAADDGFERYQRALGRPEAERVALADGLAAARDPRARALLRRELQAASTPALRLALAHAAGKHPHPELAEPLAAAIDPNAPDVGLANAVADALLGCGLPGLGAVEGLLERFGTGRSSAPARASVHQALCAALGRARTPEAWATLARASQRGHPYDRQACLAAMADAPPGPLTTAAREAALTAEVPAHVLEGLRQLAAHGHADLTGALHAVARAARNDRERPLRTGIAQVAAGALTPERFALFFASAAIVDPTLTSALAGSAAALRGNRALADWVVAQRAMWKTASELALAVRLAPASGAPETGALLVDAALSRFPDAVEPAIAALGERREQQAVPVLRRLLQQPPPERRRAAMLALHQILRADPAWREELRALLDNPDRGVLVLALDCLADLGDADSLPRAHALFEAPEWNVRAAAYDFARRVRAVPSIPLLLARLPLERGRLREDVVRALRWLTGQTLRTEMQWAAWWRDAAAWFELPPAPRSEPEPPRQGEGASTRTYYSLEVVSTAAIFVVDVSGSMEAPIGTGNERTRLTEAKRQLLRVLEGLPADHRVNVVPFSTGVQTLLPKLTPAKPETKKSLQAAIDPLRAAGATNVHDALKAAFADAEVDTIYLLTDGSPTAGPVVDPEALANEVQKWNRTRRITIHCVSVGTDSPMLQRIAKESGGKYVRAR